MTADGRTVTASEDENPELFWALHGGGGNFGVATELVFRLHAAARVSTLALLLWPAERGPEVADALPRPDRRRRAATSSAAALAYITGPPEEFVPEHLQRPASARA